jgi:hypothetical protein
LKFFNHLSWTVILLCCYQSTFSRSADSTQIISIAADIIALDESIRLKYPNAKADEYFIVITLTNTQDTTVRFRIMTCSWGESFTFDKDSLYLCYPGCDSNIPITIEILPHKAVKFFGKLCCYKKKHNNISPSSFKIGFIDLPYKATHWYPMARTFFDSFYSKEDKMKYKTYWSDSIVLKSKLYDYNVEKPVGDH